MKRHGIYIGLGTVFLTLGIAGLAMVQTGVINPGPGRARLELLPEAKAPEVSTAPSGQPAPEQSTSAPDKLAQAPVQPAPGPQQPAPQPPGNEKPIPVPKVGSGNRVYPREQQVEPPVINQKTPPKAAKEKVRIAESKQNVRRESYSARPTTNLSTPSSEQPVVVRFRFDPARDREVSVARVHLGDRVAVRVHRVGESDSRVYLTFNLPGNSDKWNYYGHKSRSGAVRTPVRDDDQVTLTAEDEFGGGLTRMLDSRDGAVLKVGTKNSRYSRYDRSYLEVEMRIYSANRWNIKPRGLL